MFQSSRALERSLHCETERNSVAFVADSCLDVMMEQLGDGGLVQAMLVQEEETFALHMNETSSEQAKKSTVNSEKNI